MTYSPAVTPAFPEESSGSSHTTVSSGLGFCPRRVRNSTFPVTSAAYTPAGEQHDQGCNQKRTHDRFSAAILRHTGSKAHPAIRSGATDHSRAHAARPARARKNEKTVAIFDVKTYH
jgi:hypothetical protein